MKELPARFSVPISTARPRASRLIEAYSPKLGRRVQLFDHASFAVWIGLEASPTVTSLCERPARLGSAANDPVIDFWVRHDGVEEFLIAAPDDAAHAWPDHVDGTSLRFVRPADRAAAGIWIANWQHTGQYRVGDDVALFDADGTSSISGADFATAVVDEIEGPVHHRAHIGIAY